MIKTWRSPSAVARAILRRQKRRAQALARQASRKALRRARECQCKVARGSQSRRLHSLLPPPPPSSPLPPRSTASMRRLVAWRRLKRRSRSDLRSLLPQMRARDRRDPKRQLSRLQSAAAIDGRNTTSRRHRRRLLPAISIVMSSLLSRADFRDGDGGDDHVVLAAAAAVAVDASASSAAVRRCRLRTPQRGGYNRARARLQNCGSSRLYSPLTVLPTHMPSTIMQVETAH